MPTANYDNYRDCLAHLQAAVDHDGVRLEFPSARNAIAHRQRCYRARKEFFSRTGDTRFGDIFMQIEQGGTVPSMRGIAKDAPATLLILPSTIRSEGVRITNLHGEAIGAVGQPDLEEVADDLEEAAMDVKRRLGLA